MLLEFKCSNHKSIKGQVTFSMAAGTDNTHEESLIKFDDKFRVLPAAVIYGPNGSGKSNFLDALSYMRNLVVRSARFQIDEEVPQYFHKLSREYADSEYDIQFVYKGVRYAYGFVVSVLCPGEGDEMTGISSEYLYFFPNNRPVKIFERECLGINPGDRYKNSFDFVRKNMLEDNRLLLSCAGNYGEVEEVRNAYLFFSKCLRTGDSVDRITVSPMTVARWSNSENKEPLKMLQSLGTNVKDIRNIPADINTLDLPPRLAARLENSDFEYEKEDYLRRRGKLKLVYDQFEIDLKEESRGVKRLFQVIPGILNALKNGEVLVFDELESSLHECILVELVRLFNDPKKNNGAQLIFSTHNTNLLDSDLFRRDQVWFTELDNEERKTELYSLVEIKNVRKSENLAKGYISGKYGAIPMLNKNILEERP